MNLGPHAGFIVAAYALAAAVVAALAVWIAADYRRQTRTLRQLEERGITRRSATTTPPAGASPRGVAL